MNSKIALEMQNALGRFLQLYHLNRHELALELFTSDGHFRMPDRALEARGTEELKQVLEHLKERRIALGTMRDTHISHTPCFAVNEDETVGMATWDLHSFEFEDPEKDRKSVV